MVIFLVTIVEAHHLFPISKQGPERAINSEEKHTDKIVIWFLPRKRLTGQRLGPGPKAPDPKHCKQPTL